jgi:hypothetical protein
MELFNGLVKVFNGVDEEGLVHSNGGQKLFILTEHCIGYSRFMSRSAFGRSQGVHVDEDAFGLFRGDC